MKLFTKMRFKWFKKNYFQIVTVSKYLYAYKNELLYTVSFFGINTILQKFFRENTDFSIFTDLVIEIFYLFWLSKPDESRVAESLNSDILLFAILASRVVCVSIRDWTSSVVGRTSSWGKVENTQSQKTSSLR